jgi:hypothetical protein
VSHLKRNQVTELEIDFYMQFDLSSGGGGSIRIPFDTLTQTIETDFFGNKPADGGAGDGDTGDGESTEESTPTPSGDATETPTDDATETPTDGATETPTEATETPTSTPTDDGSTETSTPTEDGGLL